MHSTNTLNVVQKSLQMELDNSLCSTMLGSATAGLFGRLICHPLDTCKTRIQAPPGHGHVLKSVYQTFAKTFSEEGIRGLYRGIGAVTIGGIPATCLYFTTYEVSKSSLSSNQYVSSSQLLTYFLSGMAAEAVCCIVFVPVDVVKERMQIQKYIPNDSTFVGGNQSFVYRSSWDAFSKTLNREGLGGIYRGYGATLLSFGPFSALYFGIYEKTKQAFISSSIFGLKDHNPETPLSFQASLVCSAFAGGVASFVTSPLDMAKLRLQVQRSQQAIKSLAPPPTDGVAAGHYTSFWDALVKTFKGEGGAGNRGLRALYRGAMARVFFHVPNTAISMALFEESRKWWAKYV